MPELFNEDGTIASDSTAGRVAQVASMFKQYLECLVDSGATVAELKAVTCDVLGEIVATTDSVILDRKVAIDTKEEEDAEKESD